MPTSVSGLIGIDNPIASLAVNTVANAVTGGITGLAGLAASAVNSANSNPTASGSVIGTDTVNGVTGGSSNSGGNNGGGDGNTSGNSGTVTAGGESTPSAIGLRASMYGSGSGWGVALNNYVKKKSRQRGAT
jgi:hypothetical protein